MQKKKKKKTILSGTKSANRLLVTIIVKNVTQLENIVIVIFIVMTILTKLETIFKTLTY